MLLRLGEGVIQSASLVTGGILVFFPSYTVMKRAS